MGLGRRQLWRLPREEAPSTWCAGEHQSSFIVSRDNLYFRNPEFGAEAKKELTELSGNADIHLHILDMSKPKDIIKFAKEFKEENERLDVLINNAGCMVNKR